MYEYPPTKKDRPYLTRTGLSKPKTALTSKSETKISNELRT